MQSSDSDYGGRLSGWLIRSFAIFCALLAIILIAFYFPFLLGTRAFYQSDLTYYFEPFSKFAADGYRAGKLALWNPFLYCGMAQAAVPSPGIFYPPMAFFMVGKFSQSLAAYLVFHQLIAGAGAFLLVAALGWGVLAAAVCGFTVALSGYMFALTANYTLVATIAWLPLLLYLVRSIEGRWTPQNVLRMFGASLSMFCLIAAGRPETFVPGVLLVVAYILVTAIGAYREDRMLHPAIKQAGFRLASIAGGCIMALPVILPAIEWVRLSPRSKGLDVQWVLMWSANWYDCLCMVCAQPLGDLTVLNSRFLNLVASRPNALPYVCSSYVGPVIFTLAFWSLFDKNWRWRLVVIFVLFAGLIMALGSYTPIAPFLCKLSPVFSAFRYPVKLMIFPVLALAFLAARGANLAIEKEVRPSAQIFTAVLWGVVVMTGLVFLLTPQLHLLTANFPWLKGKVVNFAVMAQAQHLFGKSLTITGLLGLLVSANYLAYIRDQFTKGIFAFLTGGTLLLTLLLPAGAFLRHGTAGDFFERQHPLVTRLQALTKGDSGQMFSVRAQPFFHDPLTLTTDFLRRQKFDFQQGFYLYTRELLLPNTNVDAKVPYSFGYEAAEEGLYKELWMQAMLPSSQNHGRPANMEINDAPIARFCAMTSTRYAITQAQMGDPPKPINPMEPQFFKLIEENKDINYRLYEVRNFAPRAYFATKLEWNASKDPFRLRIVQTDTKSLVDETSVSGAPIAGITGGAAPASTISFVDETAEHLSLKVSTDQPRLLVVTDRLYPGWTALLDGHPVEMRLVNFFARGIPVPAGSHTVEFAYSPLSVWAGLSAAAAVVLAFVLAFALARRDDSPP